MEIIVTPEAKADLAYWHNAGNKAAKKRLERIFIELSTASDIGIDQPEQLRHEFSGYWSRRIDKVNRIIYKIDKDDSKVFIISARGHYGDQ